MKKNEALLIIDVQNAMFFSLDGTAVFNGDGVLDKSSGIITGYRAAALCN